MSDHTSISSFLAAVGSFFSFPVLAFQLIPPDERYNMAGMMMKETKNQTLVLLYISQTRVVTWSGNRINVMDRLSRLFGEGGGLGGMGKHSIGSFNQKSVVHHRI